MRGRTGSAGRIRTKRTIGGSGSFQPRWSDIGGTSTGADYVVTAAVDHDGDLVYFKRASYPLGTSATWTTYGSSIDAWVSPGIASNHTGTTSGKFVAVVPEDTELANSCGSLRYYSTTSAFSSISTGVKTDMCTILSPGLEFVEGDGLNYWVMMWVEFDYSTASGLPVKYRVSTDGTTWGTIRDAGFHSLDTPNIACNYADCTISYVGATDDYSQLLNKKVVFNSSGIMTSLSTSTYNIRLERAPDIAYNSSTWWGTMLYTTDTDYLSKGYGSLHWTSDATPPINTSYVTTGLSDDSEHPGALAGNRGFGELYLILVD